MIMIYSFEEEKINKIKYFPLCEGHAQLPGESGHGGPAHESRDHLPPPGTAIKYAYHYKQCMCDLSMYVCSLSS